MAGEPLARLVQALKARGCRVRQSGKRWTGQCPAHDDNRHSLSAAEGNDGRAVVKCHAGCSTEAIVRALGLNMSDLFSRDTAKRNGKRLRGIVATYDYLDESGELLFQAVRTSPKGFFQRRSDGRGGWNTNLDGVRRVLYQLPELIEAVAMGRRVYIAEGEKDVDRLRSFGLSATTNPMGAGPGKWRTEYNAPLRGADVVILPDNDRAGRDHARAVAAALNPVAGSVRVLELPGLPPKGGDVSDWFDAGHNTEELERLVADAPPWAPVAAPTEAPTCEGAISPEDFYAYMPMHAYIFRPTRELWPASSVNARIPPQPTGRTNDNGEPEYQSATAYIDRTRPVEQMTWAPGLPELITDRVIREGGWVEEPGCTCFNLYRPPRMMGGDSERAGPWLKHLGYVYGDDVEHIVRWLAHRVQHPGVKINHALVLGGPQGIGKDSLLEPVKEAVGPWNFIEVGPTHLLGRFNGFLKAVILRVSEARDLGDVDRYSFYEHMKAYTAAPPDVLRVDEKNVREYSVPNVCGVIITTNHKADGIYLPADDRRHFVAWSERTKDDFTEAYWNQLWTWYAEGGTSHVVAYLASRVLGSFNPKAPPPKTDAFYDIVDANRAPEDAELADIIDKLQKPPAVTLSDLAKSSADDGFRLWLMDRRNSRQIPHRLEAVGYVACRNDGAKDGKWKVGDRRQVVYVPQELSQRDRLAAARRFAEAARKLSEAAR